MLLLIVVSLDFIYPLDIQILYITQMESIAWSIAYPFLLLLVMLYEAIILKLKKLSPNNMTSYTQF